MLSLLERNIAALENRLLLVAPQTADVPDFFNRVTTDLGEHTRLVHEMQRLRGSVYVDDGAVRPTQLSIDGLHQTPEDSRSWHLLMRNAEGRISSCAWYLEHENATHLQQLRVRTCPLGENLSQRGRFVEAIQSELAEARRERLRFAEVGGWAVSKECRCTSEGLLLALAGYSLGRAFGGVIGLTTATVRHHSSTILRRLGGSYLQARGEAISTYFDPHYDCQMELLRFDSRKPSPKYAGLIERIQGRLSNVTVVAAHAHRPVVSAELATCA